jgi:hypothetical protein
MSTLPDYATRDELAQLVRLLDRRLERLERAIHTNTLVFGIALFLVFFTEVLILMKVGL